MSPRVVELSAQALRERMGEALTVYIDAMGYPPGTRSHRAPLWAEHAMRPGWAAVGGLSGDSSRQSLVGIAYGYRSARGQWWSEEVRTGLLAAGRSPVEVDGVLEGAFELTELHVLPGQQGRRLGERLLRTLLAGRTEPRVVLSTPEVSDTDNRAWRLYRRVGFADLLRHHRFTGDPRPFAVLARDLPLTGGDQAT